jgi:hypothetical protein
MTFEQPAELNRFLYPARNWAERRRLMFQVLPVFLFLGVFLLESAGLKAWMADRLTWNLVPVLLSGYLSLLVLLFGIAEIATVLEQRSKRVLRLEDRRLTINPAKHRSFKWKHALKFQFEPLADASEFTKLTLFKADGLWSKTPSPRAGWSLILATRTQVPELKAALQAKLAEGVGHFEIVTRETPALTTVRASISRRGLMIYLSGGFLLFHGLPLLLGAITLLYHQSKYDSFIRTPQTQFGRWIVSHFSSPAQFNYTLLSLGLVLTVAGIGLLWRGGKLMRPKPVEAPQPNVPQTTL